MSRAVVKLHERKLVSFRNFGTKLPISLFSRFVTKIAFVTSY